MSIKFLLLAIVLSAVSVCVSATEACENYSLESNYYESSAVVVVKSLSVPMTYNEFMKSIDSDLTKAEKENVWQEYYNSFPFNYFKIEYIYKGFDTEGAEIFISSGSGFLPGKSYLLFLNKHFFLTNFRNRPVYALNRCLMVELDSSLIYWDFGQTGDRRVKEVMNQVMYLKELGKLPAGMQSIGGEDFINVR
jgi:hypothetical protein